MESKNIIISALAILLVVSVIFNSDLTGSAILSKLNPWRMATVPTSADTGVDVASKTAMGSCVTLTNDQCKGGCSSYVESFVKSYMVGNTFYSNTPTQTEIDTILNSPNWNCKKDCTYKKIYTSCNGNVQCCLKECGGSNLPNKPITVSAVVACTLACPHSGGGLNKACYAICMHMLGEDIYE